MPSSQFLAPDTLNFNGTSLPMMLEDTFQRFQPLEQSRWNESNIDSRFYAGDQDFAYNYYNFGPNYGLKRYYFNIVQAPCQMVTGYQRQHRKSFNVIPVEMSDQKTADQFNKILMYTQTKGYLGDAFSMACDQAVTNGMCLVQPYLDYSNDPINGDVKWKIWEFNSFMVDPYFREPDMSDANFVWCQKYLSRQEAILQFPDFADEISKMPSYQQSQGRFYFLPENYNIARPDLLVLSYYWYKVHDKKKKLLNTQTGETTDFFDTEANMKMYVEAFPQFEIIEVTCPVWKVGVILNEKTLYHGDNPLGFSQCPFVPVFWNYDPYIAQYNLRVRSLVRSLRDINFLFNRRIIINHDISESSLNSGWMYLEDSIANEEVMKYAGQGKDIILKEEALKLMPQKIIPNAVPPSDLALADQLFNLIYPVSGVNQELMGAAQDSKAGITELLRQGAGLVTLQKFFDQWDMSLKLLGTLSMQIIQTKWNPFKVSRIIGEQPTEQFFTKNFQKYDVLPVEGLNTAIQQQQQFAQMLEFQQMTGIQLPPKELLKAATFQGKDEIIKTLEEQQAEQSEMQKQAQMFELARMESELENLKATTAEKLALARERTGRTKSNIGLFDERISEVTENRARALKERMGALKEFVETLDKYGEYETKFGLGVLNQMEQGQEVEESTEKASSKVNNKFENATLGLEKLLI